MPVARSAASRTVSQAPAWLLGDTAAVAVGVGVGPRVGVDVAVAITVGMAGGLVAGVDAQARATSAMQAIPIATVLDDFFVPERCCVVTSDLPNLSPSSKVGNRNLRVHG
jgi:hypothetical protein